MARRRRKGRIVNGILLLDKPSGMTSNRVLQVVKFMYGAQKAGHTGSLDPLASGLLPICFGEATKISAFLLDADKRYLVTMKLGQTTDTGDSDGQVLVEKSVPALDEGQIEAVLEKYRGSIHQIPPMYSAIHHEGQRLYKLARAGIEVERTPRELVIHQLVLCEITDNELQLDVRCSKGTYVRSLVEDIGADLGCGAHVISLRRLGLGPYQDSEMVTVNELEEQGPDNHAGMDARLLPLDSAIEQWPEVNLNADLAYYLRQGQPVFVPNVTAAGQVRLYGENRVFLGIGKVQPDGKVAPKRLFNI